MKPSHLASVVMGLAALMGGGPVAAAIRHIFSYDPADAATAQIAGPVTFDLRREFLGGLTVLNLRSTVAAASADLRRTDARALGPGPRPAGMDGALYEVEPADQGAALISVLCPGAHRVWLKFSDIGFDLPLKIEVLGGQGATGGARLCHVLAYDFHGEWKGPPSGVQLREKDLPTGRYLGGPGA